MGAQDGARRRRRAPSVRAQQLAAARAQWWRTQGGRRRAAAGGVSEAAADDGEAPGVEVGNQIQLRLVEKGLRRRFGSDDEDDDGISDGLAYDGGVGDAGGPEPPIDIDDGLGEEGDYERPPPQRPVELPLGYSDGID